MHTTFAPTYSYADKDWQLTIYNAKEERVDEEERGGDQSVPIGGGTGSRKGFQVPKEMCSKKSTGGGNAGRLLVVHRTGVQQPKGVQCHCVASLKTEAKAPAEALHLW